MKLMSLAHNVHVYYLFPRIFWTDLAWSQETSQAINIYDVCFNSLGCQLFQGVTNLNAKKFLDNHCPKRPRSENLKSPMAIE